MATFTLTNGADTFAGDAADDEISGAPGDLGAGDDIQGGDGTDSFTSSSAGTLDLTLGAIFSGIEQIIGSSGDDILKISAYSQLTGAGITSVDLGTGTNTVEIAGSYLVLSDTVFSNITSYTISYSSPVGGGPGQYLGGAQVTLGSGNDTIIGGAGRDTIDGGFGDDQINGYGENDTLTGGSGNDTLNGGDNDDLLDGGAGSDSLDGGSGNDTLNGGSDTVADTLAGGAGDDSYTVVSSDDVIVEAEGGGTDSVTTGLAYYSIADNVENLTSASTFNATGNAGNNTITLSLNGSNTADVAGGGGHDLITVTNARGDRISGGEGDDTLKGGGGADSYDGGNGDDTFVINGTGDLLLDPGDALPESYTGGTGTDTVEIRDTTDFTAGVAAASFSSIEQLRFAGTAATTATLAADGTTPTALIGDDHANTLILTLASAGVFSAAGFSFSNWVAALDTLTINGTSGADTLTGASEATTLNGLDGHDSLVGGASHDSLSGGIGNDTLDGSAGGTDTLVGGTGDDIYYVTQDQTIVENAGEGTEQVYAATTFSLFTFTEVENLTLTGAGNVQGDGNILANVITGNTGNNRLFGLEGNDTMDGGIGADSLDGGDNDDEMHGGQGNDTLDGGDGADTLMGGEGDDTFSMTGDVQAGDGQIDTYNGGTGTDSLLIRNSNNFTDTILLSIEKISFVGGTSRGIFNATQLSGTTLPTTAVLDGGATVSNLRIMVGAGASFSATGFTFTNWTNDVDYIALYGTTGNERLTGSAYVDLLRGFEGNDVLTGNGGADVLEGGAGDDAYYADAGDLITELAGEGTDTIHVSANYTLGDNIEVLRLTGTAHYTGTGNAGANLLVGNAGNNRLDGAAGADSLYGGLGNDTFVIDNAGDRISEQAGEGTDTVESSVSYSLAALANVEHITLTGAGHNTATGNAGANTLIGNSGNNRLDGGAGADYLRGGAGNDTYIIENIGDRVVEAAGEGTDTVLSSVQFTIASLANVEHITLTGTGNVNANGNAGANILIGNSGNNRLDGAAGADDLRGGAGNDTYVVDNIGDRVLELAGQGTDTVVSSISYSIASLTSVENMTLTGLGALSATGNSGANLLIGNAGNNILDGKLGLDILTGGGGSDQFRFTTAPGAANADRITDFASGTDKIVLENAVMPALGAAGAFNAANFVIGTQALDAADRLVYDKAAGRLYYDADGSGAGLKQLVVTLNANTTLLAGDVLLI